ncbi:MAG: hypothetical protein KDA79_19270 [Planctomycetaceae bacterium]|nr:hypothetical protein [Planctomycetaceae bacterium]
MSYAHSPHTLCLTHQLPEDQMSPVGLVCRCCKQRLYLRRPAGRCMAYWESQPAAYSLAGAPCFVFTLRWNDYCIRSLHPPESSIDHRAEMVRAEASESPLRRQQDC